MENEIKNSNFVLIVCTPTYKNKSDRRTGGVGYEGNIITGELFAENNENKFIPILAYGNWSESAPSWLKGKYYIDLGENSYEMQYQDLLTTLMDKREQAPPVGARKNRKDSEGQDKFIESGLFSQNSGDNFKPIKISGIIVDEITCPENNLMLGSSLYKIPFQLNYPVSGDWAYIFAGVWGHPESFTSMHRPGIASAMYDKIILDGTTIEEVEKYHRDTLVWAVEETNRKYLELINANRAREKEKQAKIEKHNKNIKNKARNIKF